MIPTHPVHSPTLNLGVKRKKKERNPFSIIQQKMNTPILENLEKRSKKVTTVKRITTPKITLSGKLSMNLFDDYEDEVMSKGVRRGYIGWYDGKPKKDQWWIIKMKVDPFHRVGINENVCFYVLKPNDVSWEGPRLNTFRHKNGYFLRKTGIGYAWFKEGHPEEKFADPNPKRYAWRNIGHCWGWVRDKEKSGEFWANSLVTFKQEIVKIGVFRDHTINTTFGYLKQTYLKGLESINGLGFDPLIEAWRMKDKIWVKSDKFDKHKSIEKDSVKNGLVWKIIPKLDYKDDISHVGKWVRGPSKYREFYIRKIPRTFTLSDLALQRMSDKSKTDFEFGIAHQVTAIDNMKDLKYSYNYNAWRFKDKVLVNIKDFGWIWIDSRVFDSKDLPYFRFPQLSLDKVQVQIMLD